MSEQFNIKAYINNRIKEEVGALKNQIRAEIVRDLRAELIRDIRGELIRDIRAELIRDLQRDPHRDSRMGSDNFNRNDDSAGALTIPQQNAIVRQVIREAGGTIAKEVIGKIVPVVKHYVDEKTDSVREFVQYYNMDGDGLVTEYRKRVCANDSGVKMLTSEETRKTVFGEHTSMAFHDSESWDGR